MGPAPSNTAASAKKVVILAPQVSKSKAKAGTPQAPQAKDSASRNKTVSSEKVVQEGAKQEQSNDTLPAVVDEQKNVKRSVIKPLAAHHLPGDDEEDSTSDYLPSSSDDSQSPSHRP